MTRQEFIDNIDFWYELIDFCDEEGCDICEYIVDADDLEDRIRDDFSNYGSEYPWTDIRYWLNNIVEGHNYYVCNGSFEYEYLDAEDFERYKNDVLSWMDNNDRWDEEDDDDWVEEEAATEEPMAGDEEEEDILEEDISVSDLFTVCSGMLQTIKDTESKAAEEEAERFARFVCYHE